MRLRRLILLSSQFNVVCVFCVGFTVISILKTLLSIQQQAKPLIQISLVTLEKRDLDGKMVLKDSWMNAKMACGRLERQLRIVVSLLARGFRIGFWVSTEELVMVLIVLRMSTNKRSTGLDRQLRIAVRIVLPNLREHQILLVEELWIVCGAARTEELVVFAVIV
jgi:hypothetical protein